MARWQRQARVGLALFALGFAGVLWRLKGERTVQAPVQGVERLVGSPGTELEFAL